MLMSDYAFEPGRGQVAHLKLVLAASILAVLAVLPVGRLLLGGLLVLVPIVKPPEGPCLERHAMCAPETNHSPDLAEEPQSLPDFVTARAASPITVSLPDLARLKGQNLH